MGNHPANSVDKAKDAPKDSGQVKPFRIDLFKTIPFLKKFCKLRSFQFLVIFPNLVIFVFFLYAGLFGSRVGNRNIIIIFVWIFWWFLLITFMVPFASRVWCVVCPFPFFGEWFQRGALIKVRSGKTGGLRNKMFGLNKKWPKALSNIWLQDIGFLALCTFSALFLTRPIVSVIVLGGLFVIATILAFFYRQRAFCMYVCPVSGFQGLYAMTSMIELRAVDPEVCRRECKTKNCLTGSEKGWACPWYQYVGKMERNNYCGLCMECVKSCPNDNISVFARPFCGDIHVKGYDESWKAFIMLALAMVYAVTLLGPWGTIKEWANIAEVGNWKGFGIYAGIIWFTALIGIPAVWALASWLGKLLAGDRSIPTKEIFIKYSYMLVPLGLLAWIAFSFPLIMINGAYIISTISDPLGWGWDLFGTADIPWRPILPEYTIYIQILLLLFGLFFALKRGYDVSLTLYQDKSQAVRSLIPTGVVCAVIIFAFLRLFIG
ncbi:MAG: 4Fe-4S binding protein [Planctomycetes bacterium]|nr:4Fe-4S binding protein [Planctomycetota bacterium]